MSFTFDGKGAYGPAFDLVRRICVSSRGNVRWWPRSTTRALSAPCGLSRNVAAPRTARLWDRTRLRKRGRKCASRVTSDRFGRLFSGTLWAGADSAGYPWPPETGRLPLSLRNISLMTHKNVDEVYPRVKSAAAVR